MNKSLLALALIAAIGSAHATTGHDTPKGSNGQPGGSTSSAGGGGGGGGGSGLAAAIAANEAAAKAAADAAAKATSDQAQQQAQRAAAEANGTALGQGGNATGNGLNGSIGVTGGATTYNNTTRINTLILPPLPMGPALPAFAPSNTNAVTTACMPQKIIWREPVEVLVRNSFGPDYTQQVGWDESMRDAKEPFSLKLVPVAYDSLGQIVYRHVPYGTQAIIKKELINAASGSSFAFGGIGKSAGAQVGGMDQGAVQRWVTSIDLVPCPLDLKPAVITTTEYVEIEVERKKNNE